MKIIETKYKGYNFRSRTEARWAVFFDRLGVEYEYEPEGFILPDGTWYLPDFYLPEFGGGGYFEVKPDVKAKQEWLYKLEQLALITNKKCFILYGTPDFKYYGAYDSSKEFGWFSIIFCGGDSNYMYEGGYYVDPEECINQKIPNDFMGVDVIYAFWDKYIDAVNFSRSFRFETDKIYLG
jgi:hypothetical protein